MKIYLDNCSLQRPLDSSAQIRIHLEAEAVLGILAWIESGKIELISSDALKFEIARTPNPTRQEYAATVLKKATLSLSLNDPIKKRARSLTNSGFRPLDALHLAFAEFAQVDFFCTCDDRLERKAKTISDLAVKIVSPLELIKEIEG